jgi:hypothetical protein
MRTVRRGGQAFGCKAVLMASVVAMVFCCSLAFAGTDYDRSMDIKDIEAARQKARLQRR